MRTTGLLISLAIVLVTAALTAEQATFVPAATRTVFGQIEISVAPKMPVALITIDVPNSEKKYDGNIEAFYLIELANATDVPKPFKGEATLVFRDAESLKVTIAKSITDYQFNPTGSSASAKKITALREGRRSARATGPTTQEYL